MSKPRDLLPRLPRTAQQRVLEQFRRTAATVPFYKRFLAARGIRPERITDIARFQAAVPIIAKRDVFAAYALADLVVGGSLNGIEALITSSGATASSFSLGMIDRKGIRSMVESIDRLLDLWFQTGKKKTFMITTCAMGVTFPTTLPGSSLSVRSDRALASLRALKPYYRQFVMASDVYFLKKLLEDGRRAGVSWRKWPVQFAMGGEWFPESYRQYLASLLDVDLGQRHPPIRILSSMGAAELGFNLCYETHDTVRLRQLAGADERVREALFGAIDTVPMIGHYDPRRWFIELTPTPELGSGGGAFVFTSVTLDAAMPLIRYRTGDCGYVLPYSRVNRILRALNYSEYVPRLTTPLLAVAGRTDQSLTVKGKAVRMEFLRALLYSEPGLASATTGQFRVEERGGTLRVRIQLQADIEPSRRATIQSQFSALFNRHVPATVRAVPYFDFREVLSVDYEQKFQHRSPEPLHGE
jgi:phenylacetate-CoA ligase